MLYVRNFPCAWWVRCWRKADILSPAMHAVLDQDAGRTRAISHAGGLDELASLVSRLSVGAKSGNVDDDLSRALVGLGLSPGARPDADSRVAIDTWLNIEEDDNVAAAIVADMADDICDEGLTYLDLDSDDIELDELENHETGQSSRAAVPPPPPYTAVAKHFCELEDIAERCGMLGVSYHLRKAKLAWISSYQSRETTQTCIREFFQSATEVGEGVEVDALSGAR